MERSPEELRRPILNSPTASGVRAAGTTADGGSSPRRGSSGGGSRRAELQQSSTMVKTKHRYVFDFGHFDYNVLSPIPKLAPLHNRLKSQAISAVRIAHLTLSIASIMVITTQTMETMPPQSARTLGQAVAVLGNLARFAAAPFFLLTILQFNNFYSEWMYYKYLQNGAIIDFPESGTPKLLLKKFFPRLFVIYFGLYALFVLAVMLVFSAPVGDIVIFINGMSSVFIFWFRNQSIETEFVSMSDFIQSFPDETGEYKNIDDTSLTAAALTLTKITLIEAPDVCYAGTMRKAFWKVCQYPGWYRWILRGTVYLIAFGGMGLCIFYALYFSSQAMSQMWKEMIIPCIEVCYESTNYAMDLFPPSDSPRTNTSWVMKHCYCRCLEQLHLMGVAKHCLKNLQLGGLDVNYTHLCVVPCAFETP